MRSRVFALSCLLLTLPTVAHGARKATIAARVAECEKLLQTGDYAAALKATEPLLAELGDRLLANERSDAALGSMLALHALAEAADGRSEAAEWHWYLAEGLKPSLRELSLDVYGEAGARVDELRQRLGARCPQPSDGDAKCRMGRVCDARNLFGVPLEVEPPRKLRAPPPTYSDEMRQAGYEGKVVIRTIIDTDGRVRCPRVVEAAQPAFAYRATEAVRRWTFEPARLGDEPVDVFYNLTVNFTLRK